MKAIKINETENTFILTDGIVDDAYNLPEGFVSLEETPLKLVDDALTINEEVINNKKLEIEKQKKISEINNKVFSANINSAEVLITNHVKETFKEDLLLSLANKSSDDEIQINKNKLLSFKIAQQNAAILKKEELEKIENCNSINDVLQIKLLNIVDANQLLATEDIKT